MSIEGIEHVAQTIKEMEQKRGTIVDLVGRDKQDSEIGELFRNITQEFSSKFIRLIAENPADKKPE